MTQQLNWQERWLITSTLIVVAAGSLMLTALAGAGAAIRLGAIAGPEVDLRLGDLRLVAVTNEYPDCNTGPEGCQASFIPPPGEQPRYYTIRVVIHRQVAGPDGVTDQFESVRLLKMQAPPAPK